MLLALLVLALVAATLAAPIAARALSRRRKRDGGPRQRVRRRSELAYDPGRERRAEQRARQLLRSCVNDEEWGMYRDLGFIRVEGRHRSGGAASRSKGEGGGPAGGRSAAYAYLVYPHKPIVAYVPESGQLLSEYCVEFPDLTAGRLPASDDVLAKWMALTSDEARVIGRANMHLVGSQLDPARVRRDLWRLAEWERRRGAGSVRARRA